MLGPLKWIEIVFLLVVFSFSAIWLVMRAYPLWYRPGGPRLLTRVMRIGAGISLSCFFALFLTTFLIAFTGINVVALAAKESLWSNLFILVMLLAFGQFVTSLMWLGMSDKGPRDRR